MFFKKASPSLTKIQASNGAELAKKFKPKPEAQALAKTDQTPTEYVEALEANKQSDEAVNAMAHGMPERESVWWACQSSRQVDGKLNTADQKALASAENWVKNPTPENKALAGEAAKQTDMTGPGGWAAQAASWSGDAPATPEAPNLTAAAVAGSVLLAAGLVNRPAMPEVEKKPVEVPTERLPPSPSEPPPAPDVPPVDQNKLAKALKPFLKIGKEVASGRNTWV